MLVAALLGDPELAETLPSVRPIERVVAGGAGHQMLAGRRPAEPLEAVVGRREGLDVLDDGARADGAEGQALDLVSGLVT